MRLGQAPQSLLQALSMQMKCRRELPVFWEARQVGRRKQTQLCLRAKLQDFAHSKAMPLRSS